MDGDGAGAAAQAGPIWPHGGHPDRPGLVLVPDGWELVVRRTGQGGVEVATAAQHRWCGSDRDGYPLPATAGPCLVARERLEAHAERLRAALDAPEARWDVVGSLSAELREAGYRTWLARHDGVWRVRPPGEAAPETVRTCDLHATGEGGALEEGCDLVVRGLVFEQCGYACPEQYDVWRVDDPRDRLETMVAYVRLRHGELSATTRWSHPDERLVYSAEDDEGHPIGDGTFIDADTRRHYLVAIAAAVERDLERRRARAASGG